MSNISISQAKCGARYNLKQNQAELLHGFLGRRAYYNSRLSILKFRLLYNFPHMRKNM